MISPFHVKEYKSYDEYMQQQKSKLDDGLIEKDWFRTYSTRYPKLLEYILVACKIKPKGWSVLCLGARTGTEVEFFCKQGAFAIGIDVNTGIDNKWVVTGDASQIQYPDECVDIVYTNALDHFLEIDKCLSEIKRVLRKGGYFALLIGTPEDAEKDKWGSTYWDSLDSVLNYLKDKYGFDTIGTIDVCKTRWFSHFVLLRKS